MDFRFYMFPECWFGRRWEAIAAKSTGGVIAVQFWRFGTWPQD